MNLRPIATPLIISSFGVVAITGLCMFFGFRPGLIDPLHEISSLLFVASSILHVAVNWRSLGLHLKTKWGKVGPAVALVLLLAAILSSRGPGESGKSDFYKQAMGLFSGMDLPTIAAITHQTPVDLATKLQRNGYSKVLVGATIADISRANGKAAPETISLLLPTIQGPSAVKNDGMR